MASVLLPNPPRNVRRLAAVQKNLPLRLGVWKQRHGALHIGISSKRAPIAQGRKTGSTLSRHTQLLKRVFQSESNETRAGASDRTTVATLAETWAVVYRILPREALSKWFTLEEKDHIWRMARSRMVSIRA